MLMIETYGKFDTKIYWILIWRYIAKDLFHVLFYRVLKFVTHIKKGMKNALILLSDFAEKKIDC